MTQQHSNNSSGNLDRGDDVTVEEVRAFLSFKDYSDEQIAQLLYTIKTFTQIALTVWSKRNVEEGKIVTLTVNDDKRKAA